MTLHVLARFPKTNSSSGQGVTFKEASERIECECSTRVAPTLIASTHGVSGVLRRVGG